VVAVLPKYSNWTIQAHPSLLKWDQPSALNIANLKILKKIFDLGLYRVLHICLCSWYVDKSNARAHRTSSASEKAGWYCVRTIFSAYQI